jgi:tetratricopeptide (TPR) repeat protein
MESTPLELYETAYRFHYQESRIPDAVLYYQKLIREFPDSNECGYAVIQLQKIKAQDVAQGLHDEIASRPSPALHPLVPVTLIFSVIASMMLGFAYQSLNKKLSLEKQRFTVALDAIGKISRRDDDGALQRLSELKNLCPDNIAPWELSADVYRKQNKFDEARSEYTTYFRLNPERKPTPSQTYFMELQDRKTDRRPEPAAAAVSDTIARPSTPPPPPPPEQNAPGLRKKPLKPPVGKAKPPKPPMTGSGRVKPGPYVVDPDSISYF